MTTSLSSQMAALGDAARNAAADYRNLFHRTTFVKLAFTLNET